jgi:hypothetical protein
MKVAKAGRYPRRGHPSPDQVRDISTSQPGLVHSTSGLRKVQRDVEKHSLAAQVETSDAVENVNGDEDGVDAHGTHYLQHMEKLECTIRSWDLAACRSVSTHI